MGVGGVRMEPIAKSAPDFALQWDEFVEYLDNLRVADPRAAFVSLVRHDRWRTSYWVLRQINLMGVETMARGRTKTTQKPSNGSKQWTTFVEISLAGHSMEAVDAAYSSPDALFDGIHNMLVEGNRISLSHNVQNDAIIASVTCKDEESVNAGCTYTSFAMDWFTALKIAAYKHYVVTDGNWIGVAGKTERPMFG